MDTTTKTGKDLGMTREAGWGEWADAEVIHEYSRAQAIEDGVLVDVTEWASRATGSWGGFACPVAMTRAIWDVVDIDAKPASKRGCQSTRGRAHDVLFLASIGLRAAMARNFSDTMIRVKVGAKIRLLKVVADGDGVTIGFPEDF